MAVGAAIGGLTLAYVLFQTYELFIGGFTALVVADSALALTWSSRQRVVSWCRDRSIALLIAGKVRTFSCLPPPPPPPLSPP